MTEDTDDGIGQLLEAIINLGIDNNTYVILLSDNGGQINLTSNTPLSFGKTFITEGGIRVPFVFSGPGIKKGQNSNDPIEQSNFDGAILGFRGRFTFSSHRSVVYSVANGNILCFRLVQSPIV